MDKVWFKQIIAENYIFNFKNVDEEDEIYNIFFQNDKYLKISYDKDFWNIFDLLGMKYRLVNKEIVITKNDSVYKSLDRGTHIYRINNMSPWKGLIIKKPKYKIQYYKFDSNRNKIYNSRIIENVSTVVNPRTTNFIRQVQNTLYIKLKSFNNIDQFDFMGLEPSDEIIVDLRDNMGGLTKEAILFLDFFFKKNTVLFYLKSKKNIFKITSKTPAAVKYKKIYIFVNRNTFSSSEIVVNVIKRKLDNVIIVGDRTGGKNVTTRIFKYKNFYLKIPCFIYSVEQDFDPINGKVTPDYFISEKTMNRFLKKRVNI
ncbi:hypothetical protein F3157_13545 [Virgibacillus dakarensis]|uniref:Tail specific protease domain-containing protein n=1 Tax=Lentibacillus populi TaxID=1827502 RepID=A0A9W5X3U1_9BACI|nr:S41 family peptidase [Lentibacillus populi]MTW86676.1 hypothetical protein [Virgibacillus dakarensis]GGB29883.1 hypothetical protein GCM10011409_04030 [Lentibacillus populi]